MSRLDTRRAVAHVNLAAIERNVRRLRRELRGGARLCAVVKADGYGHGAVESAAAALAGGASTLAVAASGEAVQLRAGGLRDVQVIVMGALADVELSEALSVGAEVVVWHESQVKAVAAAGGGRVHVKLDSGMGRLGTRDPDEASRVADAAERAPGVEIVGAMTHFATADDDRDDGFFERQLRDFSAWAAAMKARHRGVTVHAANSAAVLRSADSHFDMVRCGIAIYGLDPFGSDPLAVDLEPALELRSYVAEVKECAPGQSAGYGRRFVAQQATRIAVLPIGYGDGWRRGLSNNADVLVEGERRPLVGTVSMDNVTVDIGPSARVPAGCDAVLIGAQGADRITAEEVAARLETINYEVTCGFTGRVTRVYHEDGRQPRSAAQPGPATAQPGSTTAQRGSGAAQLGPAGADSQAVGQPS